MKVIETVDSLKAMENAEELWKEGATLPGNFETGQLLRRMLKYTRGKLARIMKEPESLKKGLASRYPCHRASEFRVLDDSLLSC
jgi:hypothetical protein